MKSRDRGGARHPLIELTLARLRELVREPEALFWAFLFPVLISVALAIAFPARATRAVVVAVEPGPRAETVRQMLADVPDVTIRDVAPGEQERALRDGVVHLVLLATDPPTYRFDGERRGEPGRAPHRGRCPAGGRQGAPTRSWRAKSPSGSPVHATSTS